MTDGTEVITTTVESTGPDAWRVTVAGELDSVSADQLSSVLDPLAAQPGVAIVVNLADVSFMDSSGLRSLLRAANDAKVGGGSLVLARVSAPVTRLLEVTGLIDQLRSGSNG